MSEAKLVDLDEKKISQMKVDILKIEQENIKTNEKGHDVMVETVRKIIVNEVKKSY